VPASLALPLGALGLVFLACGVWAWRRRPSALTRVFLVYGVGGAVHWGGAVGAPNPPLEAVLLAVYVAATAFGDGAFLDLSLRYRGAPGTSGLRARAPYALGTLTLLTAPITPLPPEPVLGAALGTASLLAFLMSTAAGVLFLEHWFRAGRAERSETGLTAIAAALVVAAGVDLVAESGGLPGRPEAWKLLYGLVPLALARGLNRIGRRPSGETPITA